MCAYILRMGGPGDRTHYPGVTSAMLYQLSYRRTTTAKGKTLGRIVGVRATKAVGWIQTHTNTGKRAVAGRH